MVALRDKILVAAAALVVFGASVAGPFHLDDYSIPSDPVLTSPSGWWEVWRPAQTRPLTWFTYWVNHSLGGATPWGYHAVNVLVHVASALMALTVLSRLLPQRAALVAALLFAVHPIQAEAVDYVFALATLLATLLCLLSLDSWLRGRRWWATLWFAAALAAKEECVAFPLALLALGVAGWTSPQIAAMLLLSLGAGLRVLWATTVTAGAGSGASASLPWMNYLAAEGVVIWRYLRLLALPHGFTIDPDIPSVPAWTAVMAWMALAALVGMILKCRPESGRWFLVGILLLLPSSSIFPASDLAADRRMYLPMVALAAAVGLLVKGAPRAWMAAVVVTLALFGAARTHVWNSEARLWSEAVERSPRKVRPRIQLARSVEPARAERLLEEARSLAPEDPAPPAELGRLHLEARRPERALAEFGRALALAPGDAKAFNNRGAALAALGQSEAARADFLRALGKDPCLFDARLNLRRLGAAAGASPAGCRYTPDQARALR